MVIETPLLYCERTFASHKVLGPFSVVYVDTDGRVSPDSTRVCLTRFWKHRSNFLRRYLRHKSFERQPTSVVTCFPAAVQTPCFEMVRVQRRRGPLCHGKHDYNASTG